MNDIKFDYDDILIIPKVNVDINSRYSDIQLPQRLPLFTAPMDMVVDLDNANTFLNKGINVCLPRTISFKNFYFQYVNPHTTPNAIHRGTTEENLRNIFVSISLHEVDDVCVHYDVLLHKMHNILIDIANGHMKSILKACEQIKRTNPTINIMVGNIANPETYRWYAESGLVDYIRVGIGNGGGCLTTKQTGVGYPKASLIRETRLVKESMISGNSPAIVADGGMKDYADIVKALALGADYVMIGSLLNKCLESCAENYDTKNKPISKEQALKQFSEGKSVYKYFRGMSTKDAQRAMGKTQFKTSEGVVRYRKVEYTLDGWLENLDHYLRTAMSYSNAHTLDEFIGKAEFCQITKSAYDRFNK